MRRPAPLAAGGPRQREFAGKLRCSDFPKSPALRVWKVARPSRRRQGERSTNRAGFGNVGAELDLMTTPNLPPASWERFQQFYYNYPAIGLAVDLSRTAVTEETISAMKPAFDKAFRAMDDLEG